MAEFLVRQSDGRIIERHRTRFAAEQACKWLNEHEHMVHARVLAGVPEAIAAWHDGRPFTYHVEERG